MLQLRLHEPPGGRRQQTRDAFGRGMRAVRRREGIVHVDIAERRKLLAEALVVRLLPGMEAQVLQTGYAAILPAACHLLRRLAHAVPGEGDLLPQPLAARRGQWLPRHTTVRLALGAPEVGAQTHPGEIRKT